MNIKKFGRKKKKLKNKIKMKIRRKFIGGKRELI